MGDEAKQGKGPQRLGDHQTVGLRSTIFCVRLMDNLSGAPGALEQGEIDTAHFKGHFPESWEVPALFVSGDVDWSGTKGEGHEWSLILPRTKLGPHRQHYF